MADDPSSDTQTPDKSPQKPVQGDSGPARPAYSQNIEPGLAAFATSPLAYAAGSALAFGKSLAQGGDSGN